MSLAVNGFKVCSKKDCPYNGEPQLIDNFSSHKRYADGKQTQCKTCLNLANARYRETEARRESLKKYNSSKKGRTRKNRYQKTSEKHKASKKRYNQTDKGKANSYHQNQRSASLYKTNSEHRLKVRARGSVNYHIRVGNLLPALSFTCSNCSKCQAQEYHHFLGYEREHWLDVKPVCIPCHRNLDT